MKAISAYTALLLGVCAVAFFIAMYYVLGLDQTRDVLNTLLLGTSVTISFSWFPAAMAAIKDGIREDHDKVLITIWLSWTALLIQRMYTISVEYFNRADWIVNSPAVIVVMSLIFVAGAFAVMAPVTGEAVPPREKVWTTIAATLGGIVMGVAFTLLVLARTLNS